MILKKKKVLKDISQWIKNSVKIFQVHMKHLDFLK